MQRTRTRRQQYISSMMEQKSVYGSLALDLQELETAGSRADSSRRRAAFGVNATVNEPAVIRRPLVQEQIGWSAERHRETRGRIIPMIPAEEITAVPEQAVREKPERVSHLKLSVRIALSRLMKVLFVVSVFAVLFFVLYRQAQVEQNGVQISKLRTLVNEETKINSDLQLTLAEKYDIASVRTRAEQDMHLVFPTEEETVHIRLPE